MDAEAQYKTLIANVKALQEEANKLTITHREFLELQQRNCAAFESMQRVLDNMQFIAAGKSVESTDAPVHDRPAEG